MHFRHLLSAAAIVFASQAFAQEAKPADAEFAGKYEAYDESQRQKFLQILQANKDAVIEVEIVWNIKVSVQGQQQQQQEQKIRLNGLVVNDAGVAVMSLSHSDPAQIASVGGIPANMRGQVKVEADVKDVKIITNEAQEIAATVALKDTDLDLMFIVPKAPGKVKLPFVKLAGGSKIELLKSFFSFTRLGQSVGRAVIIQPGLISGEITTPRRCFAANAIGPAMPAFNENGEALGLFLKPAGVPMLALVPAQQILESMKQLSE